MLLKGAATLITSPEEVLFLNHYPNDGMATAGSGDVLAGMIGGLLGQGMDPFQATLLGVYLHSVAGDYAAKEFGHRSMTAQDIIENIGNAFKDLNRETPAQAGPRGKRPLVALKLSSPRSRGSLPPCLRREIAFCSRARSARAKRRLRAR